MTRTLPLLTISLAIFIAWYLACIPMNAVLTTPKIAAAGGGFATRWFTLGMMFAPCSPHRIR